MQIVNITPEAPKKSLGKEQIYVDINHPVCYIHKSIMTELTKPDKDKETDFVNTVNHVVLDCATRDCTGLLRHILEDFFSTSGKNIRSRLAYKLSIALDISPAEILPWVASCELLHSASLIHDDIQDMDNYRRDHPTVWKKFGVAQAINAGDYLLFRSTQPLLESHLSPSMKVQLLQSFSAISSRMVMGQSFEFELIKSLEESLLTEKYFSCIDMKTSALIAGIGAGIATIGSMSPKELNHITKVLSLCGRIFQIQDDLLDIYGNKGRKIGGCDIQEGKVSFLVCSHLKLNPDDVSILSHILCKDRTETSIEDILFLTETFRNKGTLKYCIDELNEIIATTLEYCEAQGDVKFKDFVRNLLRTILEPISHLDELLVI